MLRQRERLVLFSVPDLAANEKRVLGKRRVRYMDWHVDRVAVFGRVWRRSLRGKNVFASIATSGARDAARTMKWIADALFLSSTRSTLKRMMDCAKTKKTSIIYRLLIDSVPE